MGKADYLSPTGIYTRNPVNESNRDFSPTTPAPCGVGYPTKES